jgi:hypothetical protein
LFSVAWSSERYSCGREMVWRRALLRFPGLVLLSYHNSHYVVVLSTHLHICRLYLLRRRTDTVCRAAVASCSRINTFLLKMASFDLNHEISHTCTGIPVCVYIYTHVHILCMYEKMGTSVVYCIHTHFYSLAVPPVVSIRRGSTHNLNLKTPPASPPLPTGPTSVSSPPCGLHHYPSLLPAPNAPRPALC